MSGRASASGVKHLQKEHSVIKANYFFLKNCLLPLHSSTGIHQVMLANTLLKPARSSLTLCSLAADTTEHSLWHQLGTSEASTWTELQQGAAAVCSQTHQAVPVGHISVPETMASLVGTVLWSSCGTAGQSSCEGDECAVRRIYKRTISAQRLHRDENAKQCKEGGKSRDYPQRCSRWRLPRGSSLETCDFCQQKEGFFSDYRYTITEQV